MDEQCQHTQNRSLVDTADDEKEADRLVEQITENGDGDGDENYSVEECDWTYEDARRKVASSVIHQKFCEQSSGCIFRRFPALASKVYRTKENCWPRYVYPLFYASRGSLQLAQLVYDAFPEALEHHVDGGTLIHHLLACLDDPLEDVIVFLIHRYPEALKIPGGNSDLLPLHIAMESPESNFKIIKAMLNEFPEAMLEEDSEGDTPLNRTFLSSCSLQLMELFAESCPSEIDYIDFGTFPENTEIEEIDFTPSRANLLAEILSRCKSCSIDLSAFSHCESFASVLLLGLQTNLHTISLILPDDVCISKEVQFALRRLLRTHATLRDFTIGVTSTSEPGNVMPGEHNHLAYIVALAIAARTDAPLDSICFSNFHLIHDDEASFEQMLASDKIRDELKIDDCDLSVSAMNSIRRGLRRASTIRKLDLGLSTHLGELDMMQMLRETKTLKSVALSIHSASNTCGLETLSNIKELALFEVSDNAVDFTDILPRLLSNPNLRTLRLLGGAFQLKTLAPLLRQHPQLQKVEVTCVDPNGEEGADDVLTLLRTENTTLEECILVFADPPNDTQRETYCLDGVDLYQHRKELHYYCMLNKAGRQHLRDPNATQETVVNCIGELDSIDEVVTNLDNRGYEPVGDVFLDSLRYSILREVPHLWSTTSHCTEEPANVVSTFGLWNWIGQKVASHPLIQPIQGIVASLAGPRPKKRARFH
jgi:hypothetical protein